ncbi:amino acid-binding protein [Planctomycetales bacterium]|nr:amino acid-binding protein [Planctomycetales bacterium]
MTANRYVLSVLSSDRPGIIADVSSIVEQLGGNIVSCSQTVLDGYFTFITIIDLPKEYDPVQLAAAVKYPHKLNAGYQVTAVKYEPQNAVPPSGGETYIITAFGKDQPGIVKGFSRCLAAHDININDLYGGHREGDFVLVGQLTVPPEVNIHSIKEDLEETGKDYNFTVKVQHNDVFTATNRIR